MKDFNKYTFLNTLEEELKHDIETKNIADTDELMDYIHSSIENATIYYADCYAIIAELGVVDFDFELGTATNISQAAFYALYEYTMEELSIAEMEEQIEEIQEA